MVQMAAKLVRALATGGMKGVRRLTSIFIWLLWFKQLWYSLELLATSLAPKPTTRSSVPNYGLARYVVTSIKGAYAYH